MEKEKEKCADCGCDLPAGHEKYCNGCFMSRWAKGLWDVRPTGSKSEQGGQG